MNKKRQISIIVLLVAVLAGVASFIGIFLQFGDGSFIYQSIRGHDIEIYGRGLYQHMPSDVAVQGIAQDYVTLFIAIPFLLISLLGYLKNSIRSFFLLSGILGYFFVTYLFYTAMGMYNFLFLCYVTLLAFSFFGLFISIRVLEQISHYQFSEKTPAKSVGSFLMINAVAIACLWLGIIVPPLFDGSIYPLELNHFTTLIVQGFDLGLLLPVSFVVGFLLFRKKKIGYIYSTIYLGFLSLLMTALTAKIIAMAINGVNVIPVIFIIPSFNLITVLCTFYMIKNIKTKPQ
ncbi:hypothetical protein BY457_10712 [Marinilabilia salmonicolor]|jgi:hypothetical protein|uniref:hypothetical protein n=1 Tax=Marinilabilia salmonicolor TaxID=989 RepID=UPI000D06D4F6|nr:hypothetical protein [Marinilabilia salmonicolor]PRY99942.1 hypothetical protein BY457_10712 [Marinilabilia salmonicolor]